MTMPTDIPQGRVARRRAQARDRLLTAAYKLMAENGVDGTSVKDVTNRADVGYGSFFNHFESKDELVLCVLDCLINNIGLRNDIATSSIKRDRPTEVISTSVRLVIREMVSRPIWRWLLLRPDLLVQCMRRGFRPFGVRDFHLAIEKGDLDLTDEQIEIAWSTHVWLIVGCAKDLSDGYSPTEAEPFYCEHILRSMGLNQEEAAELSRKPLPDLPQLAIDFSADLETVDAAA